MPRTRRQPAYRLHKARNCAVVTFNGKNHYLGYLGPYDSPESHQRYAAHIDTWRATQDLCADHKAAALVSGRLTIAELISAYWSFAKGYDVKDGAPTKASAY
ncbi:MAG TPA: hypothetical protein VHC22_01970 [Pirellulales bacterium]|nr:hypothetical protein [Pirellulales bacterium]